MIDFVPLQECSSEWPQTISFLIRRLGIFPLITVTVRDDQLNATQRLISVTYFIFLYKKKINLPII